MKKLSVYIYIRGKDKESHVPFPASYKHITVFFL